jgi:cell division protein FtsW (lipid II flippase)
MPQLEPFLFAGQMHTTETVTSQALPGTGTTVLVSYGASRVIHFSFT